MAGRPDPCVPGLVCFPSLIGVSQRTVPTGQGVRVHLFREVCSYAQRGPWGHLRRGEMQVRRRCIFP